MSYTCIWHYTKGRNKLYAFVRPIIDNTYDKSYARIRV